MADFQALVYDRLHSSVGDRTHTTTEKTLSLLRRELGHGYVTPARFLESTAGRTIIKDMKRLAIMCSCDLLLRRGTEPAERDMRAILEVEGHIPDDVAWLYHKTIPKGTFTKRFDDGMYEVRQIFTPIDDIPGYEHWGSMLSERLFAGFYLANRELITTYIG